SLDTPGFPMFVHEAKAAMMASESAIVVVDGVHGVEVVTQRVWKFAEEIDLPRVIVASRMDRDRASFEHVMESLVAAFGRQVVPVQIPIGSEKSLKGVVDLVRSEERRVGKECRARWAPDQQQEEVNDTVAQGCGIIMNCT